jgi:NADH-quinone oxidoreductase subunit L
MGTTFGTTNMREVFHFAELYATGAGPFIGAEGTLTAIALLFFGGAMGKSGQFPLHVWLPDAMEGPTTVSALIHAATMVKAGVYLVARSYPIFAIPAVAATALTFVAVIGAFTAFFTATMALASYDIKRILAYSTLSQLAYMFFGLGVGAVVAEQAAGYTAGVFHLTSHAFTKALLFLGAGSVIHAVHTNDIRFMGGLRKYMPITYLTVLIGACANAGLPPFAGFFSKDSIVEALHLSQTPGAHFAYWLALAGIFVSGLYSFRLVFFAFHGKERFLEAHPEVHGPEEPHHEEMHGPPHESPWVVTVPLVLLAIPSLFIGAMTIGPMLYGEWFAGAIPPTATMEEMAKEFHGWWPMVVHSLTSVPLWLALAGAATAWFFFIYRPELAAVARKRFGVIVTILDRKYGFDDFNDWFFAGGARKVGTGLWAWGDKTLIDGIMVNGTARLIGWFAGRARRMQTGYIYHYAFTMIFSVAALLAFFWAFLRKF